MGVQEIITRRIVPGVVRPVSDESVERVPRTKAEQGLSTEQLLFLDWLTGDRPEGESQNQFAERIGVGQYNLEKWKRLPSFLIAWEERMLATHAHPQILSDQLEVVRDLVKNGRNDSDRLKAVELYWKLVERMAPDKVIVRNKPTEADVSSLSDVELAAELAELARELNA